MPYEIELVLQSDFSPEEQKLIWDRAERQAPDLWRKCYPRLYESYKPNLYCSPKEAARQMFGIAMKIEQGFLGDSEKYEIFWASRMAEKRCPMYWVTPDICEAIMHTTPPMSLDWYNMQLPEECITFMLPKGALVHEKDGEVLWISFYRAKRGVWINSIARNGPKQWSAENGALCVLLKTRKYLNHWNLPHSHYPIIDLRGIDEAIQRHERTVHSSGWLSSPTMDAADTHIGIKATHLIFGLLLFMLRKPEWITGGKLKNKIPPKKGQVAREFWHPAIIGENYKIKRVVRHLGGTHASPRYHWVRGFWKEQRYGLGRSNVKDIYIEPYERGLDEDD